MPPVPINLFGTHSGCILHKTILSNLVLLTIFMDFKNSESGTINTIKKEGEPAIT
jgi:hypothetical protein